MTRMLPDPGELFDDRYLIIKSIGTGGFATVFHAVDQDLRRDVALKILMPPHESQDVNETVAEQIRLRFHQEARHVSKLIDPHTIVMFDYGELDGLFYMVFEFIEGSSLSDFVSQFGAMSWRRFLPIMDQVLSSLEEAHGIGVLHRDIKPANIMLFDHIGRKDRVKVLDFGIAKAVKKQAGPKTDITAEGAMVGTPRYMSPEQIRGKELGPATDIYSFGLVAYEMLTGKKAVEATSTVTIIGQQLDTQSFILPQSIQVPEKLRDVIDRMLAKDRHVRFGSIAEVRTELSVVMTERPTQEQISVSPRPKHSRRLLTGLIASALMLIVFSMWQIQQNSTTAAAHPIAENASGIANPDNKVYIFTVPSGGMVTIGEVELGRSPATINEKDLVFPVEIQASFPNLPEERFILHQYQPKVLIEFADNQIAPHDDVKVLPNSDVRSKVGSEREPSAKPKASPSRSQVTGTERRAKGKPGTQVRKRRLTSEKPKKNGTGTKKGALVIPALDL
jgi:serine/threonine protein kinase